MTHWFTTAPNPRVRGYGPDAGQRGWKLHAVEARDDETFQAVGRRSAACGLRPAHGWGIDMFIEDKCERCMSKRSIEARTPSQRMAQIRDMIRHATKRGNDPNRVAVLRKELEELKAKQEALR